MLSSALMIGSYYCYDNPSALQDNLKTYMSDEEAKDFELYFNLLYTVYSIPNIILPFVGGYIVDWLGARWMNVVFTSLIAAGQLLFAFGCHIKSWPVMLAGRTLFGFGGESLSVGCSTIVAEWFKGKELAFALGVNISIARVGSVINDWASPRLAHWVGVPETLYIGVIICVFSVACALLIIPIDKGAERTLTRSGGHFKGQSSAEDEQIHIREVKTFQLSFWLLTFACIVVYGCVLPWNNIAQSLIITKFICHGPCANAAAKKAAQNTAGTIMGIPYLISAIASPFLGGIVDRVGGRALLAMASSMVLVGVHLAISMLNGGVDQVYAPLVFQGIAYSIFAAALWPSVPWVVKDHQVGTAYGIMTALQNGGLALFPVLVTAVFNMYNHPAGSPNAYTKMELLFVALAILGTLTGIWLNWVDRKNNGLLNKSHYGETVTEGEMGEPAAPDYDPSIAKTPAMPESRQSSLATEKVSETTALLRTESGIA